MLGCVRGWFDGAAGMQAAGGGVRIGTKAKSRQSDEDEDCCDWWVKGNEPSSNLT